MDGSVLNAAEQRGAQNGNATEWEEKREARRQGGWCVKHVTS
ncbi:MAG: hypothetical protein ACKERG_00185 [Candidatus Hodgkinia cicadicola]